MSNVNELHRGDELSGGERWGAGQSAWVNGIVPSQLLAGGNRGPELPENIDI